MKKISIILALVILMLSSVNTGKAEAEITAFGVNQYRHRLCSENMFPVIREAWSEKLAGLTYSQPIILNPVNDIGDGRLFSMAGNTFFGLNISRQINTDDKIFPAINVNGFKGPSKSSVTYGYDHTLVMATSAGAIQVYTTDGNWKGAFGAGGGKIVSAPLVVKWQGKKIIIVGTGHNAGANSGKIALLYNFSSDGKTADAGLVDFSGEISGSAAPIPAPNNESYGFIIGTDAANQVAGFFFDDFLKIENNKIFPKDNPRQRWTKLTNSGVSTSISCEYDREANRYAYYFSDKHGSYYKMYSNGEFAWRINSSGTKFIFNSPALDDKYVYFPIRYYGSFGQPGGIEVRRKSDGSFVAKIDLEGEATTAPLVWQKADAVLIGDSKSQIYAFKRGTWEPLPFAYDASLLPAGKELDDLTSEQLKNLVKPKIKVRYAPSNRSQRSIPNGITTDLSLSNGYLIFGVDDDQGNGYLVGYKAVTRDVGIPDLWTPEPIKSGTNNTVAVRLKNTNLTPQTVNLSVYWRYLNPGNGNSGPEYPIFNRQVTVPSYVYQAQNEDGETIAGGPGELLVNYYDWMAPTLPQGQVRKNIEIVAKISGMEDRFNEEKSNDIYTESRKLIVEMVDMAVDSVRQPGPVKVGTRQHGEGTFKNLGTVPTQFRAEYYMKRPGQAYQLLGSQVITLPDGGTITKGFNWIAPSSPQQVYLKAVAVPLSPSLPDVNLNNNSKEIPVQIQVINTTGSCTETNPKTVSDSWQEIYWVITGYDDEGDAIWSAVPVTYHESLTARVRLNTKQHIVTDPRNPKESDRESRGSWQIKPDTERAGTPISGKNAWEVTRAGYGFEVEVDTTYTTDFEDPQKIPRGYEGTAWPIGGTLYGPQSISVEFYDTQDNLVERVELTDPLNGDLPNDRTVTWALEREPYTSSDGKTYWERKHYTDVNIPDGYYDVVVKINGVGKNHLSLCIEDSVYIYGTMYDDVYTKPKVE